MNHDIGGGELVKRTWTRKTRAANRKLATWLRFLWSINRLNERRHKNKVKHLCLRSARSKSIVRDSDPHGFNPDGPDSILTRISTFGLSCAQRGLL